MSLFSAIFGNKKQKQATGAYFKTLTAYQPVFHTFSGSLYESELVRSAIDAKARHISKLKVEILGSAQPYLQTRMKNEPCPWCGWSSWLYRAATILEMQNNLCIVPVLDDDLKTIGYFPVLPSSCEVIDVKGVPWLRYRFSSGDVGAIEFSKCAIMTKFQYKSDFFGETNGALDKTMNLIEIQNKGIEEAVKTSTTFRFMAQLDNFATAADLKEERDSFTAKNLQSDAGGGVLLWPNGYKNIQQINSNPYTVDAAQMEQIRTNVFNYFGVNADILQNKAYGDSWSAFYEGAIEPFAIQFSDSMSKAMFTSIERSYGNEIIATSNRLQYLSNTDKLNVSSQMADRGIMSRNEIREIWNLPPIEGGDVPTIRGEYYLLNPDGTTTHHDDDLTGKDE